VVEKAPGEAGAALAVQTDGIHFAAAWEAADVVDAASVRPRARRAGWRECGLFIQCVGCPGRDLFFLLA
jgi:hypothetical protein